MDKIKTSVEKIGGKWYATFEYKSQSFHVGTASTKSDAKFTKKMLDKFFTTYKDDIINNLIIIQPWWGNYVK
jgi:hypothetical protein